MRKIWSLMALFVVSLLMVSMVSAADPLTWGQTQTSIRGAPVNDNLGWAVEINGDPVFLGNKVVEVKDQNGVIVGQDIVWEVNPANPDDDVSVPSISVDEGQTIDVVTRLYTGASAEQDIEVEAKIKGYDYGTLSDSTPLFDMTANTQKTVRLSIDLPKKLEKRIYWLHLAVYSGDTAPVTQIVKLNIEPAKYGLDIADVSFSPGNTVKAGRSLLTTVLLQNYGNNKENDVKVTVAIPQLGVSATEFVDVVSTDNSNIDYEDVPEMFLPIPATAAEGDYEVRVTAQYRNFMEVVTKTLNLHVLANEMFPTSQEETLVLAVGPEVQNVAAGSTGTYAVALTNEGYSSKAYTLQVVTGDWALASVSESLVVLEPGKNKVVYIDVTPNANAAAGEHVASLAISSGSDVLQTIGLRANVVAPAAPVQGSKVSLRSGLEIALVVLVVLLVIIGLIIGFSRLRKDEDEDEEQTYY